MNKKNRNFFTVPLGILSILLLSGCPESDAKKDDTGGLRISDSSVYEGNSGTKNLSFVISQDAEVESDTTFNYATSDSTATAGSDYIPASGELTIPAGSTSTTINIVVNGDADIEFNESFIVTISNISTGYDARDSTATGTINNDDFKISKLNDTGITFGANYPAGSNVGCTGETINQQDCNNGRDANNNDPSDGLAGFSYTKIDNNGNNLASNAADWACVKDNVTGLIWEKKQTSGIHSHLAGDYSFNGANDFADQVNGATLCGLSNWRLPNRVELLGLINIQRATFDKSVVTIDETYFPNTGSYNYWTSLSLSNLSGEVTRALVSFTRGNDTEYTYYEYSNLARRGYVRLVSDGGSQPVVVQTIIDNQ